MMKLSDDYIELTLHLGRGLYRALDDDDRQLAHLLTMALTHVDAKHGQALPTRDKLKIAGATRCNH
ncbi:MAG: hypothetical protein Pars93KO_28190 [Parasphingorhabdus sp.]